MGLKLRAYLEGDRFLVRTDHDCLRWLLSIDGTAHGRLARWRMRLNELAFDIAYKPGKTHCLADGISRLVTSGTDRSADDTDVPVFAVTRAETAWGLEAANYVSGPTTRAIDKGEVATAQGEDPLCRKVVEALNAGRAVPFFEDSDGLVRRRATHDRVAQIVVPVPLRERVLRLEHETTLAGHPGESRMYAAMRRYYYWPGMAADVVLHVRNCASCARGRVRPLRATAALQLFPATLPFQNIATDLFGPLAKTAAGNEYIMVITARFSKLVRAIPMGKIRAVDCASVLLDYWIGAYGPPDRVLSDGGSQFTAQFWHQVCNLLSVEAKVTTPSRPQKNGQAERFNRTMGRILDHYVAEHPTTCDQLLPALTLAYNRQPHAATKVAPLELVNPLGVASWSIKDLTRRSRYPATAQRGTHAEKKEQAAFLTRLVRLIPRIREALAAAQQRYKRNHDARIRPQPTGLKVGGFAFKRHHDYKGSKLGHRAQGPFRVVRIEGPTAVIDIKGEHRRENIVHLVRAPSGPPAEPALHPSLDATVRPHGPSPDGHTYHIDQILDHADGEDGRLLVIVTWTGYEDATWEDASVAPHETLRLYLRRASRRGLLHTAADRPPGVTGDNDAAAEAGTASAPLVEAEPGSPAVPDPSIGPHL